MFDFEKALANAKQDLTSNKLFLILLGASGNGKSYALGTLGVKTLYLYAEGEDHGPASAFQKGQANILPFCFNRSDEGALLSADDALKRLHAILDDVETLTKYKIKAIAIDGASEIEDILRETKFFKASTTKAFSEGPVEHGMFKVIVSKLKNLQRVIGIHVVLTCILNVKELGDDGTILDSTPALHGYQVATGLVQQFADVMLIGRMQKGGKVGYRLQLLAAASKSTGNFDTKEVRKTLNFSPRLTGVDILTLPPLLEPDLSKLIELKAKGAV